VLAGHFPQPQRIDLVEVPDPTLEPTAPYGETGQIIFQPQIACLCGSDLPYFNGEPPEYPARSVGHSLHEMVGTVTATNGQRWKEGDEVLVVPVNQCGFFERYIVSEDRAIPLDPRLDKHYAVLAQPFGTVLYGLKKLPNIIDKDVVVVGQGPIGQMFNTMLARLGAREIIALDKLDERLALSPKMGATATINVTRTDAATEVKRILGGELADVVIEAVGHADQVINTCISLVKHRGHILYFGVPPEHIDGVAWRELFYKNATIQTTVNPDFRRDFPLAMRWMAEGRVDLRPLITHTYPLTQIQTAFETFRDRREGAQKVLLEFPAYSQGWGR
jgi:threonine dehydrogenase-like Zn-dependent dehydrogenase